MFVKPMNKQTTNYHLITMFQNLIAFKKSRTIQKIIRIDLYSSSAKKKH